MYTIIESKEYVEEHGWLFFFICASRIFIIAVIISYITNIPVIAFLSPITFFTMLLITYEK